MSDEQKTLDELLEAFYKGRLIPLANLAEERGVDFFPLGSDASVETYYSDNRSNDSYVHEIDVSDLENELKKMWSRREFPQLGDLSAELTYLAHSLKEKDEISEEISPFIYAMF